MKKICLRLTIATLSLAILFLLPVSQAASLSLTSIGALNTNGSMYSEWWYTGSNPLLKGSADSGQKVTINIDGKSHEVTADSSGMWSYQTSMGSGDYTVSVAAGTQSYGFTLHLGQSLPDSVAAGSNSETTQSTGSVPTTGYPQAAGLAISVGLLSAGLYAYLKARKNTKKAYVKSVLDSVDK